MRLTGKAGAVAVLVTCLTLISACDGMFSDSQNTTHHTRRNASRVAVVKPEVASPASYKTCTETFKLEVGTPRYDKCIASLSELEGEAK